MNLFKTAVFTILRFTSLTAAVVAFAVSSTASAQSVPDMGEAAQFAVLAGSTVTNTGSTVVTGELGVSPGTAITGFPPGIVRSGQIRSNDDVAAQAVADLLSAYNDLAAQPVTTEQAAAMGMGMVLTPGVYHFTGGANITGSLVLDAQGDPSSVFVFQVEEALTVANDAQVSLTNGATAANVFWQVGTSATLGISSRFSGSIFAGAAITMNTGAVMHGRALAQTAVTMDSNIVTRTRMPTVAPPGNGTEPPPGNGTEPPPGNGTEPPSDGTPIPILPGVTRLTGEPTTAVIRAGSTADAGQTYATSFNTDQTITVFTEIAAEAAHVNQASNVFVVAHLVPETGPEQWIFKTESGVFQEWNGDVNTLQSAFSPANMAASVTYNLFSGPLDPGTYNVFVGYTSANNELIYNETPMSFTVTESM